MTAPVTAAFGPRVYHVLFGWVVTYLTLLPATPSSIRLLVQRSEVSLLPSNFLSTCLFPVSSSSFLLLYNCFNRFDLANLLDLDDSILKCARDLNSKDVCVESWDAGGRSSGTSQGTKCSTVEVGNVEGCFVARFE